MSTATDSFDDALVARTRRLLSKLHGEVKDSLQERLDRYLVAVSNAEAGGSEAKNWEATAVDRATNLARVVDEEESRRRRKRRD